MQVDIIKQVNTTPNQTAAPAKAKSDNFDSTLRDCETKTDGSAKEEKDQGDDITVVAMLGALCAVPIIPANVTVEKVMPVTTVTDVTVIASAEGNGASTQSSPQESVNQQPTNAMDPGFSHLIETPVTPQPHKEAAGEEAVSQKTAFTVPDVKVETADTKKAADVNISVSGEALTGVKTKEQPQEVFTEQPVLKNSEIPLEQAGITVDKTVIPDKQTPVATAAKPMPTNQTASKQSVPEAVSAVSTDNAKKAPVTGIKSDEAKGSFSQQKDSESGNDFKTATAAAANNSPVNRSESTENFPKALKTGTANQISDAVRQAAGTGRTEVKIHLNPEELGPISIKIVSQNGVLSVEISADNRSTGQLIASSMHELTQSMQDRGITMDKAEVSYAGSTLDASTQGQQQSSQQQGSGNNAGENAVPKWTVAMETGGKTAHDAVAAKPEEPDIKPIGDDSSISMLV